MMKKSLFWDVQRVDPKKNGGFVIGRILQFGDEEDFRWAKKTYGLPRIKKELLGARSMDEKSRNFWCQYFNVDKKECISNQSIKKQSAFWRR